jgi:predicted ATP-dependent endonuclease of OLD family
VEWAEDVTQWRKSEKPVISIELTLTTNRDEDPGIIEYITRMQKSENSVDVSKIAISKRTNAENADIDEIRINDKIVSDEYARIEILRWIRDSAFVIHHDSTSYNSMQSIWQGDSSVFSLTREEKAEIEKVGKQYSSIMKKISKTKKIQIEDLLGEIGERYIVDIDYPKLRIENMPFDITLSERKGEEIRLDNWGSGTRNRTLIFSSLIRASQMAADASNTSRVKPIVIVEEPEAFLHPSAQCNFGRVLEDIANEMGVQLLVSSHSPFLLSHSTATSNYLLERCTKRGKQYETRLVDTSGDGWLKPYSESLGMSRDELGPWNDIIQSSSGKILVVEGEIDVEYISLYSNFEPKIDAEIIIKPIGGKDKLEDKMMIKFIASFARKVVFLVDLDANKQISNFESIGLVRGEGFLVAGREGGGLRRLEGLLPDELRNKVHSENVELVDQLQSDQNSEKKLAQKALKEKYCEEYKRWIESNKRAPDLDRLVRSINKAFDGS